MSKFSGMTLLEKQKEFAFMQTLLVQYAIELGYGVTLGDAWAKGGHSKMSCHYIRLAIDINLFKGTKYLTKTSDHLPLGEFWEGMGGSWGGRFDDGNHYSIEHQGRR